MSKSRSVPLGCQECRGKRFEAFVLKDEGVGAVQCSKCSRDYLLLDSGDYWFDVIQQRPYPRPSTCSCKGTAFQLKLDYAFRDDGDVRQVDCVATCAACGKARCLLRVEIDYSPTQSLIDQPLTFCKNPRLQYDLREITLYATRADLARLIRFLSEELGCQFAACLWHKRDWMVRKVDVQEAAQAILKQTDSNFSYAWIYACCGPIKVPATSVDTSKKEDAFWKRHDIVRISPPTSIHFGSINSRPSSLYYVHFANEQVKNERVVPKRKAFRDVTARLVDWLTEEFVTWRGPNCFDNEKEHLRAFGDEYRQKAAMKSRRK